MLFAYFLYTVLMYFDTSVERWAYCLQRSLMKKIYPSADGSGTTTPRVPAASESTPLHLCDKGNMVRFSHTYIIFGIDSIRTLKGHFVQINYNESIQYIFKLR